MIRRLAPSFTAAAAGMAALTWWLANDPHPPRVLTITAVVGFTALLVALVAWLEGDRRHTAALNDRAAQLHAQAAAVRARRERNHP